MAIYTKEEQFKLINEKLFNLTEIDNQYEEVCLEAVKQYWRALQYVKEKTEKICLAAIKQNGIALQYVKRKEQTPEICLEAVRQDIRALEFVSSSILKNNYEKFLKYSILKLVESKYTILENIDLSKYCLYLLGRFEGFDILHCMTNIKNYKNEYINNLDIITCPYNIIRRHGFLDYIINLNSKIAFMVDTHLNESIMKDIVLSNNYMILLKDNYSLNKYSNLANHTLTKDDICIEYDGIPF